MTQTDFDRVLEMRIASMRTCSLRISRTRGEDCATADGEKADEAGGGRSARS